MVSDLDVLVTLKDESGNWHSFLDYLESTLGFVLIQSIGRGDKKVAYMIDGFVHVDFKLVPNKSWPFALLHFTGSKRSNIELRRRANAKGCSLNEYGLFYEHDGTLIDGITDEKSIYDFLEVPFKSPWERN